MFGFKNFTYYKKENAQAQLSDIDSEAENCPPNDMNLQPIALHRRQCAVPQKEEREIWLTCWWRILQKLGLIMLIVPNNFSFKQRDNHFNYF